MKRIYLFLLILILLLPVPSSAIIFFDVDGNMVRLGGGGGTVSFDSKFEKGASSQASPFSYVSSAGDVTGSVGANTNRVLICALGMNSIRTSLAVTWNGVLMAHIGTQVATGGGRAVDLFGLIAPATGAQTISASWTGGAADTSLGCVSVYNADQTTGWQNYTTATGTSTSASVTVTSANGNMAVAAEVDDNASSATISAGTQAWNQRNLDGNYLGAYRASTGASTTITWTLGSSVSWAMAGVDVIAN